MVTWIIGLAGAGKTTIGRALYSELKPKHPNLVFLDGDTVRKVMGEDLGHTLEDRKKNADRVCRLCSMLESQNIHVICAILSIFPESQEWNRQNYRQYYEVYIDVDKETLIKRDQKGLYSKALKGEIKNVVGFDIEFKAPLKADMIVKNDMQKLEFKELARQIIESMPSFDKGD